MRSNWIWLIALLTVFSTACSQKGSMSRVAKGRLVRGEEPAALIERSRSLYEIGEIEAAIANLRLWIDVEPYDPAQDVAYELTIEWLLQLKDRDEAKRIASYFMTHHHESPSVKKILSLFEAFDEPGKATNENIEKEPTLEDVVPEQDELLDLEESVSRAPDATIRDEHYARLADYVLHQAPLQKIEEITKKEYSRPALGLANARLALNYFHRGELAAARRSMNLALEQLPVSHRDIMAALQHDLDAIALVHPKSLGLLLPLSGSYASFGKKTLIAMSIALEIPLEPINDGITTFTKNDLTIVIADSKGDPMHAGRMVEALVKDHHVAMIIGEITNDASLLSAQKSQQLNVPMLSLSRHPLIAGLGSNIFVFNVSSAQQIEQLVNHAMTERNIKKFGILYPRHNYGISMSQLFFDAVQKKGGSVAAIEAYDTHENDFFSTVKKLVGKYYVEARPEYWECEKNKQQGLYATAKDVNNSAFCKNAIAPRVEFEALFIPEFQKLAFVVPALVQEDILVTSKPQAVRAFALATKNKDPRSVKLLGPNSWNDKNVLDKVAHQIDGAYFVDSVSFDDSEQLKQFSTTYVERSKLLPTSLEVFAHDAVKLGVQILSENTKGDNEGQSRALVRNQIAQFRGSVGLLEQVSFLPTGELNAPEIGFEITNGNVVTVKPQLVSLR